MATSRRIDDEPITEPDEEYKPTPKQTVNYARVGAEYDSLMAAVRNQEPTLPIAEDALSSRLIKDLHGVVSWVFWSHLNELEGFVFDYEEDVREFVSEQVKWIMEGVRSGEYAAGHSLLGCRTRIRGAAKRCVVERSKQIQSSPELFLTSEDGFDFDNPAIFESQQGHGTVLPIEALDVLTDDDRFVLAALEAHGGDRKATAAYLPMSGDALDKKLERITYASSIENLTLRLIDLGESRASADSLALMFLPLVGIMRAIPKGNSPPSFNALQQLGRPKSGQSMPTGYHAAVRKILLLWRENTMNEMSKS